MTQLAPPASRVVGTARQAMTAEVVRQYTGGASIRAIAEHHQRSYGFIHALLVESGVELRTRGGRRPATKRLSAEQTREYLERLREAHS